MTRAGIEVILEQATAQYPVPWNVPPDFLRATLGGNARKARCLDAHGVQIVLAARTHPDRVDRAYMSVSALQEQDDPFERLPGASDGEILRVRAQQEPGAKSKSPFANASRADRPLKNGRPVLYSRTRASRCGETACYSVDRAISSAGEP